LTAATRPKPADRPAAIKPSLSQHPATELAMHGHEPHPLQRNQSNCTLEKLPSSRRDHQGAATWLMDRKGKPTLASLCRPCGLLFRQSRNADSVFQGSCSARIRFVATRKSTMDSGHLRWALLCGGHSFSSLPERDGLGAEPNLLPDREVIGRGSGPS